MSTTATSSTARSGGSIELCTVSAKVLRLAGDSFTRLSPDGRSRSSGGSSTDENPQEPDGFVELEFRAGGPYLCPDPAAIDVLPRNHRLYSQIETVQETINEEANEILGRYGVDYSIMTFCERHSMFELGGPVPTLLITATKSSPAGNWVMPSREIAILLSRYKLSEISVEICDPRSDLLENYDPVPCSDPVYPIWDHLLSVILELSDTRYWNFIGCFRIGRNNWTENDSTILVMVKDVDVDWRIHREHIVSILDSFALPTLGVKIVCDDIVPYSVYKPELPDIALKTAVGVGQSVNRRDHDGSGTFGGWVELFKDGKWKKYGLTCSHVVLPEDTASEIRLALFILKAC